MRRAHAIVKTASSEDNPSAPVCAPGHLPLAGEVEARANTGDTGDRAGRVAKRKDCSAPSFYAVWR